MMIMINKSVPSPMYMELLPSLAFRIYPDEWLIKHRFTAREVCVV